jgi:hypothetical protein
MAHRITTTLALALPIAALCTLTLGSLGAGCGGSAAVPADAAADVAVDVAPIDAAKRDATPDVGEACAVPPGVVNQAIPDAGVDAGFDIGPCVSCLKTKCGPPLQACDDDCDCRTSLRGFLACVPQKPSPAGVQECALANFALATDTPRAIALCANSRCQAECIPPGALDGGADADARP